MDFSLSDEDKRVLLGMARESVLSVLEGRQPRFSAASPSLHRNRSAFVTLRGRDGTLRGCIGSISGARPLDETVTEMARAAAFQDPRFSPVEEAELPKIRFEISVLSPFWLTRTPEELTPGVHGAYIKRGGRTGILLPKVAVEQGWDRQQFLNHACLKAGLAPESWKHPDTQVFLFTALDFAE